ncbi:MAG: hypothetical protein RLZZ628_3020 [Bacteroidota bacterium]|jgi:hypothetical protein
MVLNFIYNQSGQPEYAVVPIQIWEMLKQHLNQPMQVIPPASVKAVPFDPTLYEGMIRYKNLDIEIELQKMRSEWTINI